MSAGVLGGRSAARVALAAHCDVRVPERVDVIVLVLGELRDRLACAVAQAVVQARRGWQYQPSKHSHSIDLQSQ